MRPLIGRIAGALALGFGLGFPLYWMLAASFRPEAELFGPWSLVPTRLTLEHYAAVLSDRRLRGAIGSSLVVAGATTALATLLGSAAAYALARLDVIGKRLIIAAILSIAMFPQIAIVPPLYLALRAVGLIDTYAGLVLADMTFALPLGVWLLYTYFRQIPSAYEEAARVDGASRLRALWEVVLPLALPGIATTAIVIFVYTWNEFLFALSFTVGSDRHTVPVALALLRGRYEVPWGQVMAAALLSTLPVALVVIAFQRRLVGALFGRAE